MTQKITLSYRCRRCKEEFYDPRNHGLQCIQEVRATPALMLAIHRCCVLSTGAELHGLCDLIGCKVEQV